MMNRNRIRTFISGTVAAAAIAAMAIGATAQAADGGGLRNCVDITGKQVNRVGCYENVWADGVEHRMTFSNLSFAGATPKELDPFYVLAPQTSAPQGYPPNTFPHDHVVRAIPAQNHGTYSVRLQGYFVLCSGEGIASGACVPSWTSLGPDPTPFAATVNGRPLTSAGAIESAVRAGLVALVIPGPDAVIVGTISGR
jgi:hypothetical protein